MPEGSVVTKHTGWVAWRGGRDGIAGAAQHLARKLLGALKTRMSAVKNMDTLSDKQVMDDGTVVEVAWMGGEPLVRVTPPGDEDEASCIMYVESGLLDLGENIADDAAERFNRGRPEFNDDPATLYFGDKMDCTAFGGINGRVEVAVNEKGIGLRGACLIGDGTPFESQLTDPVKKQAQAVCPASLWTGYMARYIAAIYGGNTINYRAAEDSNCLELIKADPDNPDADPEVLVTLSPWFESDTWGMLDIGGVMRFVKITSGGSVTVYTAGFGDCANYVMQFWRRIKDGDRGRANKVLSVALSDCRPLLETPKATFTLTLGSSRTLGSYGWAFSTVAAKAMIVLQTANDCVVHELTFDVDDDGEITCNDATVETELKPGRFWKGELLYPSPEDGDTKTEAFEQEAGDAYCLNGTTYDPAIRAWYEYDPVSKQDQHAFVRYKVDVGTPADDLEETLCDSSNTYYDSPEFDSTYSLAIPLPFVDSGCRPDLDCIYMGGRRKNTQVSSGFHLEVGGVAKWTRVELYDAFSFTAEGGVAKDITVRLKAMEPPTEANTTEFSCLSTVELIDFYVLTDGILSEGGVSVCVDMTADAPTNCHLFGFDTTPSEGGADHDINCCTDGFGTPTVTQQSLSTTLTGNAYLRDSIDVGGIDMRAPDEFLVLPYGAATLPLAVEYWLKGLRNGARTTALNGTLKIDNLHQTMTVTVQCAEGDPAGTCLDNSVIWDINYEPVLAPFGFSPATDGVLNYYQLNGLTFDQTPVPYTTTDGSNEQGVATPCAWVNDTTFDYAPTCIGAYGQEFFRSLVSSPDGDEEFDVDASVLFVDPDSPIPAFDIGDWTGSSCYANQAHLLDVPTSDDHIEVAVSEGGTKPLAKEAGESQPMYISRDFQYRALRSQLDDTVTPILNATFGASVSMDREVISGGYDTVYSPSFIGWA